MAASSKSLQCLSVSQRCSVMSEVSFVCCVLCVAWLCHVPMVFVGAAVAAADGQDRPRERKKKVQSFSAQLRLCFVSRLGCVRTQLRSATEDGRRVVLSASHGATS